MTSAREMKVQVANVKLVKKSLTEKGPWKHSRKEKSNASTGEEKLNSKEHLKAAEITPQIEVHKCSRTD